MRSPVVYRTKSEPHASGSVSAGECDLLKTVVQKTAQAMRVSSTVGLGDRASILAFLTASRPNLPFVIVKYTTKNPTLTLLPNRDPNDLRK
jgi:hypothetical protein